VSETWAKSAGLDLHLELRGTRVRAALEGALRNAVRDGRLAAGARLPSSRALAVDLGVSRNTVAGAYAQLVAEGWLEARTGAGTHVAKRPVARDGDAAAEDAPRLPRFDLTAGSPDLGAFPRAAWVAALRRALRDAPAEALGYGDPRGRIELRRALAGYLARARGVHVSPERVLVCAGFTHGLTILGQMLRRRGTRAFAVEAYGHAVHHATVRASGLQVPLLPVDAGGADVAALRQAHAALLTPAHQFPLGVALASGRRLQAVEWARRTGGLLVEDDYDGEFRYDRQPLGAMQALAPEHVVYAGTASKSLAPGLRLGWLVLPTALVEEAVAVRELSGGPSALEQLALASFLESGQYDRQVRRRRIVYRRRRDALVAVLQREVPHARIGGIEAGLHAVVELPAGVDEAAAVERARAHGVAVQGLDEFRSGGERRPPALVAGYGTPPDHAFTGALARLGAALRELV
jgi:GntR family transcriptional regulator/MocR family aminotransferase